MPVMRCVRRGVADMFVNKLSQELRHILRNLEKTSNREKN